MALFIRSEKSEAASGWDEPAANRLEKKESNLNHNRLLHSMMSYYSGDSKRIQHFIKVYHFARMIGEEEGLDGDTRLILETAAIVHDIGIRNAEQKYGECSGKLQEKEGPPEAEQMLTQLSYNRSLIERVCYLVSRHHTYTGVDGPDYQILLEADFLVNLYESGAGREQAASACEKIFRTSSGKRLCRTMFAL